MGRRSREKKAERRLDAANGLEWALRYWEALQRFDRANALADERWGKGIPAPRTGPQVCWQDFRSCLLASRPGDQYDFGRFGSMVEGQRGYSHHASIATALHSWASNSRRVYHVGEDLALLLSTTTFATLGMKDLRLPFQGFAVTIATPISYAGSAFSTFVCGTILDQRMRKTTLLAAFSAHIHDYTEPFSRLSQAMLQAAESGKRAEYERLATDVERLTRKHSTHPHEALCWPMLEEPSWTLEDCIRETFKMQSGSRERGIVEHLPVLTAVARLVFGVPVYLQSLERSERGASNAFKRLPREAILPDPNAITQGAEVCKISGSRVLSPAEREVLRRYRRNPAGEMGAHFHCGHWRRPPGKGSDPEAPKTVWVSPTIVRQDRLPDGAAAPGIKQIL